MTDPAFLFYPTDFLGGVSDLTMEERGQYITMLCLQHQKGSISQKQLTLNFQNNLSPDVLAKFEQDDVGYFNVRLRAEIEKRAQIANRQSERGKKGGAPRGNTNAKKQPENKQKNKRENNPKTTFLEDGNRNENINENRDREEGVQGGDGKAIAPMVVDTQACTVSGSEWRHSLLTYQSALRQCYKSLESDAAWLAERRRLNPRVDVLLTLEKVCVEYWATEEGWAHKKKSKSNSINWKTTLAKSIGQKFNHVYENGAGNNQGKRGNALDGDYLADLARRAGAGN